MDELVGGVPQTEMLIIGGDFNSNIGTSKYGYGGVHGGFGFGERNDGGISLLKFSLFSSIWVY